MFLVLVLTNNTLAEQISLIVDPHFDRGFEVLDPTPEALVVQDNMQWDASAGPPIWQLAQWNSQSTIFGVTPTLQPSGACAYVNADKQIIAGGGPAATESDLILTINSQNEYGGVFRGVNDPWPHLLIEQRISEPGGHLGSQSPSIAAMASLDFQIDVRLLYDNRTTSAGYDPSIHASQYLIYYTVQNLNSASAGFGDFLWFGTTLYDDREDVTGLAVLVDGGTQKLIYNIGIQPFTSEKIADGNWMTIGGDLLPHMKAGLQEAWSKGILLDSQDFADYKIGGMNMGWEMPGMNDASLQIRNYSVIATVDAPPPTPTSLVGLWEFENSGNLTKATLGSDLALSGSDTAIPGTGSGSDVDAAQVGQGSYCTVTNPIGANGGGTLTNEYSLLFDVSYPVAGIWHALFQTDPTNSNDGEYFINPGNDSWGVGDLSYTDGIPASVGEFNSSTDTWYRAVCRSIWAALFGCTSMGTWKASILSSARELTVASHSTPFSLPWLTTMAKKEL